MTQPAAPAPGVSVSRLMEIAARLFRLTLPKCLPLAMGAVLCASLPSLYWRAAGHPLDRGWPSDWRYWLLELIAVPITLYVSSAMMLQQRALIAGALLATLQALRAAAPRLPLLLASWLLTQVSLLLGFSLLIVPGVFLLVCYALMLPVALFEQRNPVGVLVRCILLVRPHWWKTLAALMIAALILLVCVLAFAAVLNILAVLLMGRLFEAIVAACSIALFAAALVFLSALVLTLHSAAASSSA